MRSSTPGSGDTPAASEVGLRLAISGPEGQEPSFQVVGQPFAVIGRSAASDVALDSPDVSFRHAYLQNVAGQLFSVDLGSRTGTHWSRGLRNRGWVFPEDTLKIGPYSLRLPETKVESSAHDIPTDLNPLEQYRDQLGPLPEVEIEFLNADPPQPVSRIKRMITLVGSSARCKLRLEHESVSSFHCSLVLSPEGLCVVDLLGRGGTRVSGQRVRFSKLRDGKELRVGRFLMRVHYLSGSPRASQSRVILSSRKPVNDDPGRDQLLPSVQDSSALAVHPAGKPSGSTIERERTEDPAVWTDEPETNVSGEELHQEKLNLLAERAELDAIRTEQEAHAEVLQQEQMRLEAMRQKLAADIDALTSARASLDADRKDLGKRTDDLDQRESALSTREEEVDQYELGLDRDRDQIAARAGKLEQGERLLQSQEESLKSRLERYQADVNSLAISESAFQKKRREFEAERASLEEARRAIVEERAALENRQAEITTENARLAEASRSTEAKTAACSQLESALSQQSVMLDRDRRSLADDRAQLYAERNAFAATVEKQSFTANEAGRTLSEKWKHLERSRAEHEAERSEFDKSRNELTQLQHLLDEEREKVSAEQTQLEKLRHEFERASQTAEHLTAEQSRLAADRAQLRDEQKRLASESSRLETLKCSLEAEQGETTKSRELVANDRATLKQLEIQIAAAQVSIRTERANLEAQFQRLTDDRAKFAAERDASRKSAETRAREAAESEQDLANRVRQLEQSRAEHDAERTRFEHHSKELILERQCSQDALEAERQKLLKGRAQLETLRRNLEVDQTSQLDDLMAAERNRIAVERTRLEGEQRRAASEQSRLEILRLSLETEQEQFAKSQARLTKERAELKRIQGLIAAERELLQRERAQFEAETRQMADNRQVTVQEVEERERPDVEGSTAPESHHDQVTRKGPLPVEATRQNKVFRTERYGDVLVVTLPQGAVPIPYSDVQIESNKIRRLFDVPGLKHLILDFGGAESPGTSLINACAMLARRLDSRGGRVACCGGSEQIQAILQSMKLFEMWPHFSARDEALRSIPL